jgi:hypothetical protein
LKDEKGLTYTVYKFNLDGAESVAWGQLQSLNLGDTVQIGYVEDLGEYEGKSVTYRTIRAFNKDIGNGMAITRLKEKRPSQRQIQRLRAILLTGGQMPSVGD